MKKFDVFLDDLECKENINIDEYYEYFLKTKNEMKKPEWLGDLEKDDFINLISQGSKHWTYYYKGNFVCSYMYIVATQKGINHLGLDYDEKECADCGPMFVQKEYRGNGLQFQMLKKLEEYCIEKGFKYILTTADPENTYSSNNMIKAGYTKVGFKLLKRGPRDIYVRNVNDKRNSIMNKIEF